MKLKYGQMLKLLRIKTKDWSMSSLISFFRRLTIFLFVSFLFLYENTQAQIKDSLKTAYLPDAAEEYWPAYQPTESRHFPDMIKHMPVRNNKGFISLGGNFREVYEYYDNHLWGRGPQD